MLLHDLVDHPLVSDTLGCHADTVDCPFDRVFEPERWPCLLGSRITLNFGQGRSRGLGFLSLRPEDFERRRDSLAGGSRDPLGTSWSERRGIFGYRQQNGSGLLGSFVSRGQVVLDGFQDSIAAKRGRPFGVGRDGSEVVEYRALRAG